MGSTGWQKQGRKNQQGKFVNKKRKERGQVRKL